MIYHQAHEVFSRPIELRGSAERRKKKRSCRTECHPDCHLGRGGENKIHAKTCATHRMGTRLLRCQTRHTLPSPMSDYHAKEKKPLPPWSHFSEEGRPKKKVIRKESQLPARMKYAFLGIGFQLHGSPASAQRLANTETRSQKDWMIPITPPVLDGTGKR